MTKENVTVVPDAVVDLAEWRRCFESQVTPQLFASALRYAEKRVGGIRRAGGRVDSEHALDLVQEALCDTYAGVLVWDPTSCSLVEHVRQTIRSRSRHERERARDVTWVSLDVRDPERPASLLEVEAELATARQPTPERDDRHALASRLVDVAVAERDNDLLLILRAMAGGAESREEVLKDTGLDEMRYRNARKRLRGHLSRLEISGVRAGCSSHSRSSVP